ncbi:DUF1682-domain-containing protein [Durotheca rogersii]|uniref:DUF1682-domain-containing protein n=1 Tax=Durotheca rogersii TaxID=419775 RepID=UPI00221E540F|nr:DUF1682-domain-containing protein [Durotheca rogersii]KAI5860549.1 DUF1682-domain-containing protein [Durotheca rogersii]
MADFFKNIVGGGSTTTSSAAPAASADSDFADFADAPSPVPVPFEPSAATTFGAAPTGRPYTKWYNIHERYSLSDFRGEGIILIIIGVIFTLHFIGARRNRAKARAWIKAHGSILASEFAVVGFGAASTPDQEPEKMIKAKSLFEYATYATGRQNVAFMDLKLTLQKRFNPVMNFIETAMGFFIDSVSAPEDSVDVTIYPFDGKEAQIVPSIPGAAELRSKDAKSAFDGFVWAIVNKDKMKQLREERYDLSITFTKDNTKLPIWTTVMSESAEITETFLTNELADAIKQAGDLFDFLIISDQPVDKPKKMDETIPRKRILLRYRLPSSDNYEGLAPLLAYTLRLPDQLATAAHFRPEVLRKVRAVRDEAVRQIQKAAEEEKAEERQAERDRARKAKRDAELNALDAKAQKRYLEKEREKEMRKSSKKQTMRA